MPGGGCGHAGFVAVEECVVGMVGIAPVFGFLAGEVEEGLEVGGEDVEA